eukprot:scaffold40869_cov18-Tisochrysis_lutea.AAC.3
MAIIPQAASASETSLEAALILCLYKITEASLHAASALEAPWNQHRYFINWRNAHLNGVPLDPEGLAKKLRDYSIPAAGTLKIDYVMYQ